MNESIASIIKEAAGDKNKTTEVKVEPEVVIEKPLVIPRLKLNDK